MSQKARGVYAQKWNRASAVGKMLKLAENLWRVIGGDQKP